MIVMGAPVSYIRYGRHCRSTHLISTIPGNLGRVELLAFAKRLGLRQQWLQRIGSDFEHFDVMGGKRIALAKAFGAKEVDRHRLIEVVQNKREARTGSKRRRAIAYANAVKRNSTREQNQCASA